MVPHTDPLAPPEGAVVVGRLAELVAEPGPAALADGLALLVESLGLHSAVLRAQAGDVLAVAGEVVHAVPAGRATAGRALRVVDGPELAFPVGAEAALEVTGARPSHLPVLRAAASVLRLALTADRSSVAPATALLLADEADRDELADALHDGPVQALVVARYAADAAVRGSDPALVREAVQEALVALRRSLWHLRPRGDVDLMAALRALSDRLVEQGGTALDLHGHGSALSGAAAGLAYRVVQGVALAHDGALRVGLDQGRVELRGRMPTTTARWRSRARALGGELSATPDLLQLVLPVISDPKATP